MTVQITIRDVPDRIRAELAARAARQGQSMQEYLRGQLVKLAERPTLEAWLAALRERKAVAPTRVPAKQILAHRDADRR